MRLQGIKPSTFKVVVSDVALGNQIGNAMSVNVIERVLFSVLQNTKLMPTTHAADRWKSGLAQKELFSTQTKISKHKNPDTGRVRRALLSKSKRSLIVDSGASYHLISENDLSESEKQTMKAMHIPIALNTANGIVWAKWCATIYVQELDIEVEAVLLDSTVAVLSLGKLIKDEGFEYIWRQTEEPYLQKGDSKYTCYTEHDVPFLTAAKEMETSESGKKEKKLTNSQLLKEIKDIIKPAKKKSKKKIKSCQTCTHNIYTHFPRDPNCEICQNNKTHRAYLKSKLEPARRSAGTKEICRCHHHGSQNTKRRRSIKRKGSCRTSHKRQIYSMAAVLCGPRQICRRNKNGSAKICGTTTKHTSRIQ